MMPAAQKRVVACLSTALFALALAAPAWAGDDQIVSARQANMKNLQNSLSILKDAVNNELDGLNRDEMTVILESARTLATGTRLIEPTFRTETPLRSRRTRAAPKIWQDWPGYVTEADNARVAAQTLLDDIEDDNLRRLEASFTVVARTCSSCHRKYRAR